MFLRVIITQLKLGLRSKKYMFWTLAFPIVLGTLFVFAFSSIYDGERSKAIPVVIEVEDSAIDEFDTLMTFASLDTDKMSDDLNTYYEEVKQLPEPPVNQETLDALESVESYDDIKNFDSSLLPDKYITDKPEISESDLPFIQLMNELEYENGTKMIDRVTFESHEEALKSLEEGDIAGIITVNDLEDIQLLVNGEGTDHSILSSIISEYKLNVDLTIESMNSETTNFNSIDEGMDDVITNVSYIEAKTTNADNKDPFVQYFYNLIAMVALMGSMASLSSINSNQANQETVGIRIDSSPINKVIYELGQLIAVLFIQMIIITITLSYLVFIHKIQFGGDLSMVYVTATLANILGVILGYFVAHIGKMDVNKKESILMSIVLGGGFLAGLMYGDMKAILEEKAPIVNRINPAAVITDAFYSLNVYGIGDRYYRACAYMLGLSLVMLVIGMIKSRQNSYKSL